MHMSTKKKKKKINQQKKGDNKKHIIHHPVLSTLAIAVILILGALSLWNVEGEMIQAKIAKKERVSDCSKLPPNDGDINNARKIENCIDIFAQSSDDKKNKGDAETLVLLKKIQKIQNKSGVKKKEASKSVNPQLQIELDKCEEETATFSDAENCEKEKRAKYAK